jgi:hypothetical protein
MSDKIWECKIGAVNPTLLLQGSDLPMRIAVEEAYFKLTGKHCDFCFSGWGAELDAYELQAWRGDPFPAWHYQAWKIEQMNISLRDKPFRHRIAEFLLKMLGASYPK